MFCQSEYEGRAVRLDPGDQLGLYTDGVTEASNRDGAEYGAERLAQQLARLAARPTLTARGVVAACRDDLARFRAGAPPSDDLTLMVVRREG